MRQFKTIHSAKKNNLKNVTKKTSLDCIAKLQQQTTASLSLIYNQPNLIARNAILSRPLSLP